MTYQEALSEKEQYTKRFTEYVDELRARSNRAKLEEFSEVRKFSMKTIEDTGIFYIGDAVEMMLPRFMSELDSFGVISKTNRKPIFHNRYIIPIKDTSGRILNLVGYSKDADERYVYGTARYYRRREDMWGLEKLHTAYEKGYALLTEGITDAIAVRNLGEDFDVTFANCGTHGSSRIVRQLNRCRYGIVRLPDRDKAGQRAVKKWECNRYITLNTFIQFKDVDEMIKVAENGSEWVKSYLDECIDWIKKKEHMGYPSEKVDVTMY